MLSPIFISIGVDLVGFTVAKVEHTDSELCCLHSLLFLLHSVLVHTKIPNLVSFLSFSFHPLLSLKDGIIKVKYGRAYTIR